MESSLDQAPAVQPSVGSAQGIWHAFGETQALSDVSIDIRAGECHALVGRNGAGKSTLVAVLTGLLKPARGVVKFGDAAPPSLTDRAAWQRQVACVYQKSMVVPTLTVAENVFLNRAPVTARGLVDWGTMRANARDVMREWGFDLDVTHLAQELTVEQRQIVEIARALSVGARFLILDEPTAALEKSASERLFERLRRLKSSGVGIMFISHHLEEVYEICEQVTVLRDGKRILNGSVSDVLQARLIAAMVGDVSHQRDVAAPAGLPPAPPDAPVRLDVSHLSVATPLGKVDDVSLTIRASECVGLVGLRGSGSTAVADAIAGLLTPIKGQVKLDGAPVAPGNVTEAWRRGIAYVPEDRHTRGFIPYLGVDENLTMAVVERYTHWGVIDETSRKSAAQSLVNRLDVVASGLDQRVGQLSGGNQQKVVVGRALAREPDVLVVVTPTVGVDVASKETVLNIINAARESGTAVLLVTDDLDDLRICTRLLVMARGKLVREFAQAPWDRHALIAAVEGLDAQPSETSAEASVKGDLR
jgi:simple sugar transport system ATP-binding protein